MNNEQIMSLRLFDSLLDKEQRANLNRYISVMKHSYTPEAIKLKEFLVEYTDHIMLAEDAEMVAKVMAKCNEIARMSIWAQLQKNTDHLFAVHPYIEIMMVAVVQGKSPEQMVPKGPSLRNWKCSIKDEDFRFYLSAGNIKKRQQGYAGKRYSSNVDSAMPSFSSAKFLEAEKRWITSKLRRYVKRQTERSLKVDLCEFANS